MEGGGSMPDYHKPINEILEAEYKLELWEKHCEVSS